MHHRTAVAPRRWANWYVAAGVCLIAAYVALDGGARAIAYDAVGLVGLTGVGLVALRARSRTAIAWWVIFLGLSLAIAGDVTRTVSDLFLDRQMLFPSLADALNASSYPFIAAGLFQLCWRFGPSRSDVIDAAIAGAGFALVGWTTLHEPMHPGYAAPWLERAAPVAYLIAGVPLASATALVLLTLGARSRELMLVGLAAVATVVSDLLIAIRVTAGTEIPAGLIAVTSLTSYLAWGLAALAWQKQQRRRLNRPLSMRSSVLRLAFPATGMIASPAVWLIQHQDRDLFGLIVVSGLNGLLVALVCWRLWDTLQALDRNERRFRALVEHSSDVISVFDPDGVIRYVSPALTSMLGHMPDDWIDRNAISLIHPDDASQLKDAFARLKQRPGEQALVNLRLRHRSGEWRTIEAVATNNLDDPAVRGIVVNARDMTARTRAEEALREAEALNCSVIDSGSDGILAYDRDCRITVWNPTMERTTGIDRSLAIGRNVFDIFPFLKETGEDEILYAALRGEHGISRAQANQFPEEGEDGFYETYYSPLRDSSGNATGGLCLVRNVTDRAIAERALASHNRVLELSASGAPLDDVFSETCRELEKSIAGGLCSIMLIDPLAKRLIPTAGPNLPAGFLGAVMANGGLTLGLDTSPCGRAALLGQPVISADIAGDPAWSHIADLALANGIRAAWSVPILDGETADVLGTFGVFHRAPRGPSERELSLVIETGKLVGMAIRAHRARDAMRFQADLLDQVTAAVVAADVRGIVTHWNRFASVLYGWTREEAIGRDIITLLTGCPDGGSAGTVADRIKAGEPWVGDVTARRKDDTSIALQLSLAPLTDSRGMPAGHVAVAVDLSERKALEARLAHQAFHDALTGLPNRALFADRLERALSISSHRGYAVAVLMLDLDRFKTINDALGHAAGDRLLIAVARRVGACLGATDTLARLGGDEFAILIEDTTAINTRETAERVLTALEAPLIVDGREIYVATSIGISLSTRERSRPEELLRAADIALYRAKRAGRGTLNVFDPNETDPDASWLALEADLRRALANRELVLHYQPIFELDSYEIVTVEALVRWQHPRRGLLPPAEFIPLAEETGFITAITEWVISEACSQLASWRRDLADRAPGQINVNLTTRDLRNPEFIDRVMHALAMAELPPHCLRLEIAEEVLVGEIRSATSALAALRERGVWLAIDDFGAGASSLASLRAIDAETIKLDRAFVRGLAEGGDDRVVVAAITAMAHALGMAVTAEGIETGQQLAAARAVGCDHGQGFLLARPMPPVELGRWLAGAGSHHSVGDEVPALLVQRPTDADRAHETAS